MDIVAITVEFYSAIMCFVFLLFLIIDKNLHDRSHTVFASMLCTNIAILFCDAMTYYVNGNAKTISTVYVLQFFVYTFSYILLMLYGCYVASFIKKPSRRFIIVNRIIMIMCVVSVASVALSMFNHMYFYIDENGYYVRGKGFWFSQIYSVIVLITSMCMIIYNRKSIGTRNTIFLLSYTILPIIALSSQVFISGFPLLYVATTLALIIIFITVQFEQSRKLHRKEKELSDATIAIMMTQVQPHFLYNALTSIAQLCDENPSKAKAATIGFSNYLRGNLDSLNNPNPVPFENELYHTGNYLKLEKIRFDDELNIEYDIKSNDFVLPSLSLQPLAENAVKHGVGKKIGGGTVKISSFENNYYYFITVEDDGVGFDINEVKNDGRTHIGIENTKNRLLSQCGGTLTIESNVGVGSKATIKIPKVDNI